MRAPADGARARGGSPIGGGLCCIARGDCTGLLPVFCSGERGAFFGASSTRGVTGESKKIPYRLQDRTRSARTGHISASEFFFSCSERASASILVRGRLGIGFWRFLQGGLIPFTALGEGIKSRREGCFACLVYELASQAGHVLRGLIETTYPRINILVVGVEHGRQHRLK